MNSKISIRILICYCKKNTNEYLESLKHITYSNYEIRLVDNGSTDGSVGCFKERYSGLGLIEDG
ncbi:glycosyltransferase [Candidatus Pacearchaeota archaeon]|nr:glycosyltransferase [Candidatus Pacearchaeota archaeon]